MLIGISGKIGSGKDTIGKIIQMLTSPNYRNEYFHKIGIDNNRLSEYNFSDSDWQVRKFADKLKDIVCLLIGCIREQLEDADFKNTELGPEWWYYKVKNVGDGYRLVNYLDNEESEEWLKIANPRFLIKLTPRLLLQLLGTDCGRNIIHPNIWVNSLMSEYKKSVFREKKFIPLVGEVTNSSLTDYPNWIITDLRFPNELQAVKKRGGISIRVERLVDSENKPIIRENEHSSETALDDAGFNYIIHNSGSIKTLIALVKEILIQEKII